MCVLQLMGYMNMRVNAFRNNLFQNLKTPYDGIEIYMY